MTESVRGRGGALSGWHGDVDKRGEDLFTHHYDVGGCLRLPVFMSHIQYNPVRLTVFMSDIHTFEKQSCEACFHSVLQDMS